MFASKHFHSMKLPFSILITLVLLLVSGEVFAEGEGATLKLPYEQGLGAFRESLQGPVPFAISLVGIVACGAMLIFGGEISGFMRTMIFIILVVAVIVQADNIVTGLGGSLTGGSGDGNTSVLDASRIATARALG